MNLQVLKRRCPRQVWKTIQLNIDQRSERDQTICLALLAKLNVKNEG